MRLMLLGIEVNVLLWLAMAGGIWSRAAQDAPLSWDTIAERDAAIVMVGVLFSVVFHHWAYYRLKRTCGHGGPRNGRRGLDAHRSS